jgi:uncharacterized protein
MAEKFIARGIAPVLRRASREFPVVVLTGPRQAGKTTLLRHLFGVNHRYAALDLPDVRDSATQDPRGFLDAYPPPVIFDEVQQAPGLLPYIRERVDTRRAKSGQYILTGSQNLMLMRHVTESLAGRAAILRLFPLSQREVRGQLDAPLPWEKSRNVAGSSPVSSGSALWRAFLRGGYPSLIAHPRRDSTQWYASYVETYLERDIRGLRAIGDLSQFRSFLRALAARSAQLVSLSDIARDLGIAVNTIKAWISILEATHQIIVVRPYFANVGKRLVKTPKVYFTDVGVLCYLCGLRDPDHAAAGPMAGPIFETAVLSEITRAYLQRGVESQIYFWRTSAGQEVDFVVEIAPGSLVAIEAKLSATPRPTMAQGIHRLQEDLGSGLKAGFLVHTGRTRLPLGAGVTALPYGEL